MRIILTIVIVMLALPSGFSAAADGGEPATPELETALKKIERCHITVECHAFYDGYWGPKGNENQTFPGAGWEILTGEFKGCTFEGSENYTSGDYTSAWEATVTIDETASYVTSFELSTLVKDSAGETKQHITMADEEKHRIPRIGVSDLPRLLQDSSGDISSEDYEALQEEFSRNTYYSVTGEDSCNYVKEIEYSNWVITSDGKIETTLIDHKCNADSFVRIMFFGSLPEVETCLTLQHFHPFSTEEINKPYTGGDLVATLKDNYGNGIPGKEVFFFKKRLCTTFPCPPGDRGFDESFRFPETEPLYMEAASQNTLGRVYGDYASDFTDGITGEAKYSYLSNIHPGDYIYLGNLLRDHGEVRATIYAVVFDKSPRQAYPDGSLAKIEHISSVAFTIQGIAVIMKKGALDTSKKSEVKVGGLTVNSFPHYLVWGDKVEFNNNARLEIQFLSGLGIKVEVKPGFLKDKDFQYLEIGLKDVGWYRWADLQIKEIWTVFTLGVGPTLLGLIVQSEPVGAIGTFAVATFGVVFYYWGEAYDPLIVVPRSTILFDLADEINIYTVDGTATLYSNANGGDTVDVTTGHKVSISPDGEFSTLSEFEQTQLDDGLKNILASMRVEETTESSEPEQTIEGSTGPATITTGGTGLTIESRSKPRGSTVQIPLTLTGVPGNIGNMDITLEYDPSVLEITEVVRGSLTAESLFDYNIRGGVIKVSLADSEGFNGNGSLIYVKGSVIGAEGSSCSLRFTEIMANGVDYDALDIATTQGEFRVTRSGEQLAGDYNGDGRITTLDALCALQMADGKRAEDLGMDVNGDGRVSSDDARLLLEQAVAGEK